jgi:hypothetical protein
MKAECDVNSTFASLLEIFFITVARTNNLTGKFYFRSSGTKNYSYDSICR